MTVSIGSILSTAKTAMQASQTAVAVVSHNVANAATEGYSRQRVQLTPGTPQYLPFGVVGTGVRVTDVERVRDALLDLGFRAETASAAFHERRGDLLGQIEALHGNITNAALPTALDRFWNAWSDLANDPSSRTAHTLVQQAGRNVVDQLRRLSGGLDRLAATTVQDMGQDVLQLNALAQEVAALNTRILAAEAGGHTAGDHRDARDLAIDKMARLADIQVVDRPDGTVAINVDGINLVDGGDSSDVVLSAAGGTWSVVSAGGANIRVREGRIGAGLSVLNTDIAAARSGLDTFARELAIAVNTAHATGMNAAGQTNVLFFDDLGNPATITAATLSLSAAVTADPMAIAAGSPATDPVSGLPVYGAARNDVALLVAGLRNAPTAAYGGRSLSDGYLAEVGRIGTDVRTALDKAHVHGSLAAGVDTRRLSVSGVSIDEEMVALIKFQNAYAAAARLVTAADEMMQTILEMKR